MLLAFSEQTKGQKFPEHASDQEMLEIVMDRLTSLPNLFWVFIVTLDIIFPLDIIFQQIP
jgi:hypothetical protein